MNIGEAIKLFAEVALDEKVAELQLHAANVDDSVDISLPVAGQIEWADGGKHFKVVGFTVKRVK